MNHNAKELYIGFTSIETVSIVLSLHDHLNTMRVEITLNKALLRN